MLSKRKAELEVIEVNIGEVDIVFHPAGAGNFSGDVVRNYLWDIYGPGIDTEAVVSVEIPELRYDTNEELIIKVTQEKRDESPEYNHIYEDYKYLAIGDISINFYDYNGDLAEQGCKVKSFMWQIEGAGINTKRVRGVLIPKLQKTYPESMRVLVDYECRER